MGIGGGGLFALYLHFTEEMPQIELQTLNLLFFVFAAFAGMLFHLCRQKIHFGAVLVMIVFGAAGSLLGSAIALKTDGELLSKIFGLMMLSTGVWSFFQKSK